MYQSITNRLKKIFRPDQIFKYGFNWSPMYKRSVGRVKFISRDLHIVKVEIPLNYKNKNFVGSMFGGSMLSATDPIYMIQLMQILGDDFVVWDKEATIKYIRPAREKVYITFEFTTDEIEAIKKDVELNNEIDYVKEVNILTKQNKLIAKLDKTMYVAQKSFYKEKIKKRDKM